ncbi:hypothetical protein T4B_6655 [Trichinella pseudospiralis]|uniref:Uncharacterized protein n=1 Tax=Trichinella pseudospiralis TaxID=6337 RepID=A0A0V1GKD4_TRIPS|nr:hypothetical protein T4B_6655 [Trichinella pseudospiralis]
MKTSSLAACQLTLTSYLRGLCLLTMIYTKTVNFVEHCEPSLGEHFSLHFM